MNHWKRAGITPTTVTGAPLRLNVWPTTEGSPPKRRSHSPWLRMTTRCELGLASSGVKPRPLIGSTPRSGKRFGVAYWTMTSSGSPPPVRLTRPSV
jgi:hypothetical protein